MLRLLGALALAAAFIAPATAQETLVVYWTKGFYPQEDKALDDMIAKFQQKTGVKIELSRYSPQESVPKAVAALDSGTPPDVAYGDVFDFQVAGKWAYEGQLEDLSDILAPMNKDSQGNDLGTSYRSAIYYTNDAQRRVAEETIGDVNASGLWPGKVVTEVAPAGPFWQAESEHQDYLQRYPDGYTCHFVRPGWKLPRRQKQAGAA